VLNRTVMTASLCLLLVAAAGCNFGKRPPAVEVPVYEGPLLGVAEVVRALSQGAAPVRSVWARHDFSVVALDERGRERRLDGDGVLMLRKSAGGVAGVTGMTGVGVAGVGVGGVGVTELKLTGSKDVAGPVFDLGVNRERSWLTFFGDIDQMVWLSNGAEIETRSGEVPIRPDMVPEVLGLGDWRTDLAAFPSPVMTYDAKLDQYVLTLIEPSRDGATLTTRRQVWVDRASLQIRRIVLFGPDSRPAAVSELTEWKPLAGTSGLVPHDVVVSFPQSKANLRLRLRDVRASRNGLPSDLSFRFPTKPGVSKVVELGNSAKQ
jgi:hypothetical protein